MTLDVKWTKWLVQPNQISRRYDYIDDDSGATPSIEMFCTFNSGIFMPNRFVLLKIEPCYFEKEGYSVGLFETQDSESTTGLIALRTGPTADRKKTLIGLLDRETSDKFYSVMLTGKDTHFVLMPNPQETIFDLPMPNMAEFRALHDAIWRRL